MGEVRWLTRYGPEGASSRYRAYQYASRLEGAGWRSQFDPMTVRGATRAGLVGGLARRAVRLHGLGGRQGRDEVVVFQKEPLMPPAAFVALAEVLRRPPSPVVWDVDDAVWIGRAGAARMTRLMCDWSDVAVAGNALIAEHLDRLGVDTVVVPTCYTPEETVTDEGRSSRPRLLWIGSPATAPLLVPYVDTLEAALAAIPELTMEFVGGSPPGVLAQHPRVDVTSWSPAAELTGLRRAQFGLAVQPRTPYADHKCGFKIVQYLSAGLVPIASDGPVHREIVGAVGTVVAGPSDRAVVERLRDLPTRSDSDASRARWRERYSTERGADAWAKLLNRW